MVVVAIVNVPETTEVPDAVSEKVKVADPVPPATRSSCSSVSSIIISMFSTPKQLKVGMMRSKPEGKVLGIANPAPPS